MLIYIIIHIIYCDAKVPKKRIFNHQNLYKHKKLKSLIFTEIEIKHIYTSFNFS